MSTEHLVAMVNDIGSFFAAEIHEEDRVAGVRDHLRRFWDPRMRRRILDYARAGGQGLAPHVVQAVLLLDTPES